VSISVIFYFECINSWSRISFLVHLAFVNGFDVLFDAYPVNASNDPITETDYIARLSALMSIGRLRNMAPYWLDEAVKHISKPIKRCRKMQQKNVKRTNKSLCLKL